MPIIRLGGIEASDAIVPPLYRPFAGSSGEMITMIANRRGVICLLIFGLLTAGLCGCDQKLPSWSPFATPVVNNHGITTPTRRIKSLQELAKKAPETTDPGQRESICQELEQQIRKGEPDATVRGEILRPWQPMAALPPRPCCGWP